MQLDFNDTQNLRLISVGEARIDAAGPDRIILDMAQVDFIDSSGLGAVVAAMKQVGGGKVLELAGLSPTVQKVFQLTRMDTVFTIHSSAADVLGVHGPRA